MKSSAPRLPADAALRITAVVAAVALVCILTFVPPSTNDFWLQARIGQLIVKTGEIPRTVLFTFTEARDHSFNAHEWLPSVLFHLMDSAWGYDRLVFVHGSFGLLLFGLGAGLAWRLTRSLGASLLLGASAVVVANYRHVLRPELFALVFLLLTLHVMVSYQKCGRWPVLLWVLPLGVVWANSHGSFLLGPIVAALFAAGEALQAVWRAPPGLSWARRLRLGLRAGVPYGAAALAMLAVSAINPLGFGLLRFALTLSTSEVTKIHINEWNPTLTRDFMRSPPFVFFAAMFFASVAAMLFGRRTVRLADVALVIAFAGLALQRVRFVALFGFAAILACARGLGERRVPLERWLLVTVSIACAAGIAAAVRMGNVRGAYPWFSPSTDFTEPMLEQLADTAVSGNVITSYELGAELIYRAWPRLKPSIDSRIDSYGDAYFLSHHQLLQDEAVLRRFVAAHDVRYMLLLWRDFVVIKDMPRIHEDRWRLIFRDHKMVLLTRKPK
jgi:hypothetical protein